jgi:hypothetical protein
LFHLFSNSSLSIENLWLYGARTLDDGHAENGRGGVVLNDHGQLQIKQAKLGIDQYSAYFGDRANVAEIAGGGIFARGGTTNIVGSYIAGGLAAKGGAVYLESGTLEINGSTLHNNRALFDGGAVYVESGNLHVTGQSALTENYLRYTGSGAGISNQVNGTTLVEGGSKIDDNTTMLAFAPVHISGVGIFNAGTLRVRDGVSISGNYYVPVSDDRIDVLSGLAVNNTGTAIPGSGSKMPSANDRVWLGCKRNSSCFHSVPSI